mmetsp:Transcript_7440/g.17708  ORF Transcript_7440/g.17708 Transcript_7440/m.17708 type:complete len:266 (+) Transcript_7440:159-956(+)
MTKLRPLRGDLTEDALVPGHLEALALRRASCSHVARATSHNVNVPGLDEVLRNVPGRSNDDFVDPLAGTNVQNALVQVHHRKVLSPSSAYACIVIDADQEEGAESTGLLEELGVADMKHVERATRIDDLVLRSWLSRCRKLSDAPGAGQKLHWSLGPLLRATRLCWRRASLHKASARMWCSCSRDLCLEGPKVLLIDFVAFPELVHSKQRFPHGIGEIYVRRRHGTLLNCCIWADAVAHVRRLLATEVSWLVPRQSQQAADKVGG